MIVGLYGGSGQMGQVRQALYRLQREGQVQVNFRSGWQVSPLDFARFEELYDLRIVLELEAVRRLCQRPEVEPGPALQQLGRTWLVQPEQRLHDGKAVSLLDEQFHCLLVEAGGELGGVLPLHKRAGRLQLGAFAVVCLGKQLRHHIGGGVAVNALGRKIVQNLAAGLALAQQLRGSAAGKRDIV